MGSAPAHEVLMKNRGAAGQMVYQPDYPGIQPGKSVKYDQVGLCGLKCPRITHWAW